MRESKECAECGGIYFRPEWEKSASRWEARNYCSVKCAGEVGRRKLKEKQQGERGEKFMPQTLALEQAMAVPEAERPKEPVKRDLRIVRVGPNPRMVVCEYFELAERRLCTVLVKRTEKFVRGMQLKMAEPADEMAYRRPWVYQGPPPRHRGRW